MEVFEGSVVVRESLNRGSLKPKPPFGMGHFETGVRRENLLFRGWLEEEGLQKQGGSKQGAAIEEGQNEGVRTRGV